MTERQQALLTYVMTIQGHVRGHRSMNELVDRIMRCVVEDAEFVARGLSAGALQFGRKSLDRKLRATHGEVAADTVAGALAPLSKAVEDWILGLGSKRTGKR